MRPIRWLGIPTRLRGVAMAGIGLTFPASESQIRRVETRLDEFAPAWQFREFHTIRIAASPPRVFQSIKRVRADEIFLFRTFIWIRSGGQPVPENIRKADARGESLIDVATATTFVRLAHDPPRELVVCVLARDLSRKRDHPPDVATSHRAKGHRSERHVMTGTLLKCLQVSCGRWPCTCTFCYR